MCDVSGNERYQEETKQSEREEVRKKKRQRNIEKVIEAEMKKDKNQQW